MFPAGVLRAPALDAALHPACNHGLWRAKCTLHTAFCLTGCVSGARSQVPARPPTATPPPAYRQVFCLPDNYEVVDRSLDDVRHVLDPRFNKADVARLDKVGQGVQRWWGRLCCCYAPCSSSSLLPCAHMHRISDKNLMKAKTLKALPPSIPSTHTCCVPLAGRDVGALAGWH